MSLIEIKESELKSITLFLIDKKIILHPKISPDGIPDFSGYEGKKFIVILDRNILIRILRLVNNGELKDAHSLQIVSCLLAWSEFNNIALNSGLALTEYSYHHKGNIESSKENNIFLQIYDQYSPRDWFDLAMGKTRTIQKIHLKEEKDYEFFVEDDHFKMHYLEMLKLSQLYFSDDIEVEKKFELFHKWTFENILICKYTTYFAVMLFGGKSKTLRNKKLNFDSIKRICKNVAWDLTYLSFWSTQYYYEKDAKEIYLFATMDKELRDLFFLTHKESLEIYREVFGEKKGNNIIDSVSEIYVRRDKPEINQIVLDKLINQEQLYLTEILNRNTQSNTA
ncbi:MAG: hypothetical protein KDC85_18030 [Saprospiraceae bacterium]|nr:hypothetical protein [Saprospiraceae bacterium]